MNQARALNLSNQIYRATRKHDIPANIFTAILMQESHYSLKARGCHSGLREEFIEDTLQCSETGDGVTCESGTLILIETKICSDFGISQIYFKTAKRYGFDIELLITDLEYSIDAGAQVLSYFKKRFENTDINWWTRYNCGNRSTTERDTCQNYKRLVERYL